MTLWSPEKPSVPEMEKALLEQHNIDQKLEAAAKAASLAEMPVEAAKSMPKAKAKAMLDPKPRPPPPRTNMPKLPQVLPDGFKFPPTVPPPKSEAQWAAYNAAKKAPPTKTPPKVKSEDIVMAGGDAQQANQPEVRDEDPPETKVEYLKAT